MKTDLPRLRRLLKTKTPLRVIARRLGMHYQTVQYHRRRLGYAPMKSWTTGPNHKSWRGGRFIDRYGYVMVMAPQAGRANKYVAEHLLIMEKRLGRPLTRQERVHHINGNPADNREENLWLCDGPSSHRRLHFELEALCYELLTAGVIKFEDGHYRRS